MTNPIEQLLTPKQVSEAIGITEGALANQRTLGTGAPFVKVGKLVRYRPADVQTWIDQCTAEAKAASEHGEATQLEGSNQ